jgi:hypothetical protein
MWMLCIVCQTSFMLWAVKYGTSMTSFKNNKDPQHTGQGVLQGSSSAARIYNFSIDVSLTTYSKLATGSTFIHPSTGQQITDFATQYLDDKTKMINTKGLNSSNALSKIQTRAELFEAANNNTALWTKLLWISSDNLNPQKCFYYYIEPKYNHNTGRIQYTSNKHSPGEITVHNPETNQVMTLLKREHPYDGKRTLGVILAPDGNCSQQIAQCQEMAASYIGKLRHSKLSQKAKWTAITSILEPGVMYPLIITNSTRKDLEKIDKIFTPFKCQSLGLNEHFPRTVLYGPLSLGGLALPSTISKTTSSRLTYFFYHTRMDGHQRRPKT